MVLNPRLAERGNCTADGNRVAATPSHFKVLRTLFFIQRSATKLCRNERYPADRASVITGTVCGITDGTIFERSWMRPCRNGILRRKRLEDQLRFATGTSDEECRTGRRAIVADLGRRRPGLASCQRSRSDIQGPIKIIRKNVNLGCAMRDGANQATKGALRTRGYLGLRKSGRYKVKLVQVATAPKKPRGIRAHLLGAKRGDQCGPARSAFFNFLAIFCGAQRAVLQRIPCLIPFDGESDGVAAAETKGSDAALQVAALQFVEQRDENARA